MADSLKSAIDGQTAGRAELRGSEPPQPPQGGPDSSRGIPNRQEMPGQNPPQPPQVGPGKPAGGAAQPFRPVEKFAAKGKGKANPYAKKDDDDTDDVGEAILRVVAGENALEIAKALLTPAKTEAIGQASQAGQASPQPDQGGPSQDPSRERPMPNPNQPNFEQEVGGWLDDMPEQKYRNIGDVKIWKIGNNEFQIEGIGGGLSKAAAVAAIVTLGGLQKVYGTTTPVSK